MIEVIDLRCRAWRILSLFAVLFAAAFPIGCDTSGGDAGNPGTQARVVPVTVEQVSSRLFERRIEVQGNLESKVFAEISPRVAGTIVEVYVDERDEVVANETRLFRIDDVKLRQAVDMGNQALAVAKCALGEAQAGLEQVAVQLEKSKLDLERYERLYEKRTVSLDSLEQQQSRYKQDEAAYRHAESVVDLQKETVVQAAVALRVAEKDLKDTLIMAPIGGTVTHQYCEEGEAGEIAKPVFRIEDTSRIEVSAFLPAQHYAAVVLGETQMRVMVSGIDAGQHPVSFKSPTIDPRLRTFEVKCLLQDAPEGVVPGAIADVSIVLQSRRGLGIPKASVLKRSRGQAVFIVEGDKARQVEIEVGLETDGYIEILNSPVKEGTMVVTEGQTFLSDGSLVKISEGAN